MVFSRTAGFAFASVGPSFFMPAVLIVSETLTQDLGRAGEAGR